MFPHNGTVRDQLSFLVRYAILAPSSHNSQPWQFIISQETIRIQPQEKRMLPFCDPDKRLLFIALGCALENLLIAADYFGFQTHIVKAEDEIRVSFQKKDQTAVPPSVHRIFSIPKRRMNRNPYEDRMPDIEWMKAYGTAEMEVHTVTEQKKRNDIADVMLAFKTYKFSDIHFRQELARYKRNNFTRLFTGIPGFTMGFPHVKSFLAPLAIRLLNVAKLTQKEDEELLKRQTPVLVLLCTKEDNHKTWIEVGQLYERLSLHAIELGMQTAINAIPDRLDFLSKLKGIVQTAYHPQIFFRLGFALKTPEHSPRLPIEEVITYV
ncbi:MAG TPA: hypothetical protein VEA18_00980 [Candidatus Kapabacteria bacterium]|nr:hypothetical protein [Candidatus Kapabacteria bacterium]